MRHGILWLAFSFVACSTAPERPTELVPVPRAPVALVPSTPQPAPVLHVTSDPEGASVQVDGIAVSDVTPAFVPVAPGAHEVRLELADHSPVTMLVGAASGPPPTLPTIRLARARQRVRFTSDPLGATVRVRNGSHVHTSCTTPCEATILLAAGPYVIDLEAPGHDRWAAPLDANESHVDVVMRPTMVALVTTLADSATGVGTGTLSINSMPWSEVTVDGRPVGNTPIRNLSVSGGTHTVRFVNGITPAQFETRRVVVGAGTSTPVVVRFPSP